MSVEAMAIALHHSKAKAATKLVLIGIANHDGDGGAWPSLATLAKYGGCSDRHARTAIRELEELGEVRTHLQQGGPRDMDDRHRPNRYEFTLRCPASCDGTTKHRQRDPGGNHSSPLASVQGGTTDPPPGEPQFRPGGNPSSPKPSLEPSINRGGGRVRDEAAPPGGSLPPRFCDDHPAGTATPCRACGARGRDYDLAAQRRAEERERERHERLMADDLAARRTAAPPPIDQLREAVRRRRSSA